MREIKFRGKTKDGRWVTGNYEHLVLSDREVYKIVPTKLNIEMPEIVILETVGQYTGLKDCNDKEIYECDIVQYTVNFMEVTGVVKWGNKRGGFVVKHQFIEYPTKSLKTKYYSIPSNSYVIGNIYDNPELLEGDNHDTQA